MSKKNDRTGEINYNKQGLKMWIKEYRNARDTDVEFEDGFIAYNKKYESFKMGQIAHNTYTTLLDRTGEVNHNRYGSKMTIVKYIKNNNILVLFDNGWEVISNYSDFKNGSISNPYDKTVYGIGYLGEGNHKTHNNLSPTKIYQCWREMLRRCYNEKERKKFPSYKDCVVCDEWLNFQNFAQWYENNLYQIDGEVMEIDKDILIKGNKIYSPNSCIIVPNRINVLFIKNSINRGEYPIGVCYHNSAKKFSSSYKNGCGNNVNIGLFDTPMEAFSAYKCEKEKYIKEIADKYKDKIPQILYDAMINWKVEITD